MRLYGSLGNSEFAGDFLVARAFGQEQGSFLFPCGKRRAPGLRIGRRNGARRRGEKPLHQALADPDSARPDRPGDLLQNLRCGMAIAIAGGAGSKRGQCIILRRRVRKDDQRATCDVFVQTTRQRHDRLALRMQRPDDAFARRNGIKPANREAGECIAPGVAPARVDGEKNRGQISAP